MAAMAQQRSLGEVAVDGSMADEEGLLEKGGEMGSTLGSAHGWWRLGMVWICAGFGRSMDGRRRRAGAVAAAEAGPGPWRPALRGPVDLSRCQRGRCQGRMPENPELAGSHGRRSTEEGV